MTLGLSCVLQDDDEDDDERGDAASRAQGNPVDHAPSLTRRRGRYPARMRDQVRLLGKAGGYTDKPSRAMSQEEPEAVSREEQARQTLQAARSWPHMNALQSGLRASAPLGERLRRASAQAKALRLDVHKELRLARLAIEGGRSHAAVERRIEVLEQRVWPDR